MFKDHLREGMPVRTADGEKLGKVLHIDDGHLVIEKGLFFREEHTVRIDDVDRIEDGVVCLTATREQIVSGYEGREVGGMGSSRQGSEETRMPLSEEELRVAKRESEEQVRVKKHVVTEEKEIPVTTREERIEVERVAVPERPATPGEASFEPDEISMTAKKEEAELEKRPVVKEEVRVTKTPIEREETHRAKVRREEADIEKDEDRDLDRPTPDDEQPRV